MAATKVLVVDDSLTMRALISGALERIPNVQVVGLADGAAKARELVALLQPHVMTLDVEMPGMSGIDYLAEIMSSKPMPVIMFSTRTTEGAADSIEALRLGAIDCFPKPRVAAPAELDAIIAKLGKRIKAAKGAELRKAAAPVAAAAPPIDWNGRLLVIGGDASSTARLFELFGAFPANCPPTLVVQHLGPGLVEGMVTKLAQQVTPKVVVAEDGMAVEQGTIYFAPQGDHHLVVDAWPSGTLRLLPREPVAGERPSISLLFAAAAKAAGANAVGALLIDGSEDGGGGLKALLGAGSYAFSPAASGGYTLARNMASQPTASDALPAAMLKLCSK
ncbi:chemotaxis protein CheB [Sphingomonas rubra]|uniref:protein-glutamate methylesterase n=1 Tax=Sphingomonas rubra TaxID=634430 RepID=A0A1I5SN57_9SPHN|nr:chemotaxis protein CheB [Sphingomonas rubra]SFP72224.1 two-component system, chemotaxis family, response regulator CheB [Sphingomonas rubra]